MRPITGLTVIECKYLYDAWSVEVSNGEPVFTSSVREITRRIKITNRMKESLEISPTRSVRLSKKAMR